MRSLLCIAFAALGSRALADLINDAESLVQQHLGQDFLEDRPVTEEEKKALKEVTTKVVKQALKATSDKAQSAMKRTEQGLDRVKQRMNGAISEFTSAVDQAKQASRQKIEDVERKFADQVNIYNREEKKRRSVLGKKIKHGVHDAVSSATLLFNSTWHRSHDEGVSRVHEIQKQMDMVNEVRKKRANMQIGTDAAMNEAIKRHRDELAHREMEYEEHQAKRQVDDVHAHERQLHKVEWDLGHPNCDPEKVGDCCMWCVREHHYHHEIAEHTYPQFCWNCHGFHELFEGSNASA